MSDMIQRLESRVLFSSIATFVADGAQLATDIRTARADVIQYATALSKDVRTVGADVRSTPASAQKQTLLKTLRTDEAKWTSVIRADVRSAVNVANANGRHTISDAILVFRHPTNLAYIGKLAADLAAIGSGLNAPLNQLQSDATSAYTALLGDLNNIAAANPTDTKLQTDVQQITAESQSAITKLTADGQTIKSDLAALGVKLGG